MICPKCHAEYRDGFFKCADCDIWLVNVLPEAPASTPANPNAPSAAGMESDIPIDEPEEGEFEFQPLVTVLNTNNLSVLLMARAVLDSAGIDYYTQGASLGGIVDSRLLVRESEAEEALRLLDTLPQEREAGESDETLPDDSEPPQS
jgi:hypothetical protein